MHFLQVFNTNSKLWSNCKLFCCLGCSSAPLCQWERRLIFELNLFASILGDSTRFELKFRPRCTKRIYSVSRVYKQKTLVWMNLWRDILVGRLCSDRQLSSYSPNSDLKLFLHRTRHKFCLNRDFPARGTPIWTKTWIPYFYSQLGLQSESLSFAHLSTATF